MHNWFNKYKNEKSENKTNKKVTFKKISSNIICFIINASVFFYILNNGFKSVSSKILNIMATSAMTRRVIK